MIPGRPIRVVIVDDEPIIRDGLTLYLDSADDIEVVACLANGAELLDYLDTHQADLVLLDVRMPVLDGLAALSRLTTAHVHVRVLFMTSFADDETVDQALSGGGDGYVLKSATPEEIRAAVRAVVRGGVPVSPEINARIVREAASHYRGRSRPNDFGLSERESEVLELLCQAASNRDIALRLGLSESTVKAYVSSIMTRMGCTSRLHVVVTAFEQGLVTPGPRG